MKSLFGTWGLVKEPRPLRVRVSVHATKAYSALNPRDCDGPASFGPAKFE
jgi:hypothetical protein